jgi:hypothetical protein
MLNGKGLDERTSLFKALREKEQELVTALGGDPSPQQQTIIADAIKNMLYVASLDNYLMSLKPGTKVISRPAPPAFKYCDSRLLSGAYPHNQISQKKSAWQGDLLNEAAEEHEADSAK